MLPGWRRPPPRLSFHRFQSGTCQYRCAAYRARVSHGRPLRVAVLDSFDTDEADITGETYIEASRGSNTSSTSSGTRSNLVDTEDTDNRDEFDESSNGRFVPDKDGRYWFVAFAHVFGASSGDTVVIHIRDTDNSSDVEVGGDYRDVLSANPDYVQRTIPADLTAGTTYEVQVVDTSSSYRLGTTSKVQIIRAVVHP